MSGVPLGVFTDRWEPEGEPVGTAVVLPGKGYPPAAPALAYAGYVLRAAGWVVRDVWWDEPARSSAGWVEARLTAALAGVDGPVLVVGKSLGSLAAGLAAARSYPAVWLTPLLTVPACVEGIRANPARQLLVGGTRDDLWDADVAAALAAGASSVEVLEVEGLDHAFLDPADPVRSAEGLLEITRTMARFVGR